jgi:hypothetical protein
MGLAYLLIVREFLSVVSDAEGKVEPLAFARYSHLHAVPRRGWLHRFLTDGGILIWVRSDFRFASALSEFSDLQVLHLKRGTFECG